MEGISFVKDEKGNIVSVVIDLRVHQAAFDEFYNKLLEKEKKGKGQPTGQPTGSLPPQKPLRREETISNILQKARTFLGTKHQAGGTTNVGIDCSGLSTTAFQAANVKLPRSSSDQARFGIPVDKSQLQPGDLVFFATDDKNPGKVTHVGIVTQGVESGEPKMIHASTSRGVVEEKLFSDYYTKRYLNATRVIS